MHLFARPSSGEVGEQNYSLAGVADTFCLGVEAKSLPMESSRRRAQTACQ